jgi:hypothetical protein
MDEELDGPESSPIRPTDEPAAKPAKSELEEIVGLSRKKGEIYVVVKYAGERDAKPISLAAAHRKHLRELLTYYEKFLVPHPVGDE